jgi:hypothetical protein
MSHNSTIIIDGCEAELTWHGALLNKSDFG